MMPINWGDAIKSAGNVAKDIVLLKDRFDRQEKELDKQRDAVAALREENAKLTARLAVLESVVQESRKTTDEHVRAEIAIAVSELRNKYNEVVTDLRFQAKEEEMERRFKAKEEEMERRLNERTAALLPAPLPPSPPTK